jgi:hypothetical protein
MQRSTEANGGCSTLTAASKRGNRREATTMQAEWLEKWIAEKSQYAMYDKITGEDSATVEDLRALLAGKVLCEKEPVYMFRRRGQRDWCSCDADRYAELGAKNTYFEVRILYAPADIGKPVCKHCNGSGVNRTDPNAGNCTYCDISKEGGE